MIEREFDSVDGFVSSINEAGDSEMVGFIDGACSFDRMDHRSSNDIWVDNSQVKGNFVLLEEFPCCGFGSGFRNIVSENGVISFNSLLSCDLSLCKKLGPVVYTKCKMGCLLGSNLSRCKVCPL